VLADLAPRVIEDHAASARRTLVDCSDEVGHGPNTSVLRRELATYVRGPRNRAATFET
jgi:hypothetical protein